MVAWAPAIALMALLFLLSHQPGLSFSPDPGTDLPIRRLAHLIAYGVLAVLLLLPFEGIPGRNAWAVGVAVLWAVSDELHQATIADRNGAPEDVLIDGVGAVLGLGFVALVRRRREESARYSRSRGR